MKAPHPIFNFVCNLLLNIALFIMGPEAIDYRVSKIVVLCKDCGQDVGMYPARHKCEEVVRPPLPPLPTSSQLSGLQSRNITRDRSPARSDRPASPPPSPMPSKKPEANRKPKFGRNLSSETTEDEDTSDRQIYFNDIGDDSAASTPSSSGRKLWGNLKQNEKWKQMAYGGTVDHCQQLESNCLLRLMFLPLFFTLLQKNSRIQMARGYGTN